MHKIKLLSSTTPLWANVFILPAVTQVSAQFVNDKQTVRSVSLCLIVLDRKTPLMVQI